MSTPSSPSVVLLVGRGFPGPVPGPLSVPGRVSAKFPGLSGLFAILPRFRCTAVSSEAWAKLRDWASVAGRGRLLLSGSVAHASLKTAVNLSCSQFGYQ